MRTRTCTSMVGVKLTALDLDRLDALARQGETSRSEVIRLALRLVDTVEPARLRLTGNDKPAGEPAGAV